VSVIWITVLPDLNKVMKTADRDGLDLWTKSVSDCIKHGTIMQTVQCSWIQIRSFSVFFRQKRC